MAAPNKTIQAALLAWAEIATGNATVGTAFDVSTKWAGSFFVRFGRRSATAFTAGWPNVRIEASGASSGNDHWVPLFVLQPQVGASIANTTLNGAISAGATSCVVTANTNLVVGDKCFLGRADADTSKYEIVRVKAISGTTITFEEACTYAHDTAAPFSNQAEIYCPSADLTAYTRVRAVADNANGGVTVAIEIILITFDSYL